MSATLIAGQKGSEVAVLFDVLDASGNILTGQAALVTKNLRDELGAAAEAVTVVEQGTSGFYKATFTPTKGGSPPETYFLQILEPAGTFGRAHQWTIQSYDAIPVPAGPVSALTTLSALKEALKITTSGDDAYLTNLISRVSAVIKTYTERVLTQTTLTEIHDGLGFSELVLRDGPIISVTSVHESLDQIFDATTLLDAADYVVDTRLARIWRSGYVPFQDWIQSVKVVYVAGYAAIPADLEHRAIVIASREWNLRLAHGVTAKSLGDGNINYYSATELTADDRRHLDAYRRHALIAA